MTKTVQYSKTVVEMNYDLHIVRIVRTTSDKTCRCCLTVQIGYSKCGRVGHRHITTQNNITKTSLSSIEEEINSSQGPVRQMTLKINDRLSFKGELCTVRFIGELPAWPGEVAIGVEWDSASKGKHNGSYKGQQYFQTRSETSGSFLKASKPHDGTRSFYKALIDTYATTVDEKEIKIGKKLVESYGFDKLQRLQSDLGYLKNISLSRKQINSVEVEELDLIKNGLVNLQELDLSFNLFSDLGVVLDIISNLDLVSLNLTGNVFTKVSSNVSSNLRSLNLSLTNSSKHILETLDTRFPTLEKLYLEDNNYTSFDLQLSNFKSLNLLDLSINKLTTIPEVIKDSTLTNLNVANNNISITETDSTYPHITTLDIRRNNIESWEEVELLNTLFSNVTELRINGNPLFRELSSEEADYNVIARWPSLTLLNGVKITPDERTNAELYFLSEVNEGRVKYDESKLQLLSKKLGRSINVQKPKKNELDADLINLKFKVPDSQLELTLLKSLEVIRLRGMLSRLLKRSVLDFQITYNIGQFKESFDNDLAVLSSFNFEDGQVLTVELMDI